MSTFSQVVDELVLEHLRPDLLITISSFVNQSIRDVHSQRSNEAPILFESNRMEAEGTISATPAIWTIPKVTSFQRLESLYYPDYGVYAKKRHPNRAFDSSLTPFFWYRSGPAIVMGGLQVNNGFKLSYFDFPRFLPYYPANLRPAIYDATSETFAYLPDYDVSSATRLAAVDLTTNWLLLRWKECIKQGARAKIFTRLGEVERARMAYSTFEQERSQLHQSESFEASPEM